MIYPIVVSFSIFSSKVLSIKTSPKQRLERFQFRVSCYTLYTLKNRPRAVIHWRIVLHSVGLIFHVRYRLRSADLSDVFTDQTKIARETKVTRENIRNNSETVRIGFAAFRNNEAVPCDIETSICTWLVAIEEAIHQLTMVSSVNRDWPR